MEQHCGENSFKLGRVCSLPFFKWDLLTGMACEATWGQSRLVPLKKKLKKNNKAESHAYAVQVRKVASVPLRIQSRGRRLPGSSALDDNGPAAVLQSSVWLSR